MSGKGGPGYTKRAGKHGKVVYIRVNPNDCMTCIDVCQKVKTITTGMSFAQLVSFALATLCRTVRDDGAVPKRSGFEYAEMMSPWDVNTKNTKTKIRLNKAAELQGSEFVVPALPVGQDNEDVVISNNPRIAKWEREVQELRAKQVIDPVNDRSTEIDQLTQMIAEEYRKDQS